jgi:hypothetical protein
MNPDFKQEVSSSKTIGWKEFKHPPKIPEGSKSFFYFSTECIDGCTLNIKQMVLSKILNPSITKFNINLKVRVVFQFTLIFQTVFHLIKNISYLSIG